MSEADLNLGGAPAPTMKTYAGRALLLVVASIILNIALGRLAQDVLKLPLYLDSIGTILTGALLGPVAGAATGALSNLIWSTLFGDSRLAPYAITAAFVGWAAGYAVSRGAFRRWWTVVLAGLLTGIGAAVISAPITTFVFGNVTGAGTDFLTGYLGATGANLLQAATVQGFISDPLDKAISFTAAWLLWRILRPYFRPPWERGSRVFESLQGYGVAIVASLLALFFCFVFLPAFERGIWMIFLVAVVVSAWRGGLGPALLTIAVGTVGNVVFLASAYSHGGITAEDVLRAIVFVFVSGSTAIVADRLEKSKRHLQEALQAEREGRAQIRAITDGVDEALLLISPDQRILDVNRRFGELFGVPDERIVGQRLEDAGNVFQQVFAEPELLHDFALQSSADAKQDQTRIVAQRWPQPRELQLYSAAIRDDGGFLGRLFVFRDVTREREVDRMKTEFVSLVSHELRTPLTSIKGFTEMVLDGDAGEINEEVTEFLGIVHSNAERLVALVNDLLDLSRIESGRIQLKIETVDLNEVARTVALTMQPKIQEKHQTLTVTVDPAAASVRGDRDKLVQVLTNYVSNAHKYTQEAGEIRVVVGKRDDCALVAVSDNGHGIAAEDQARLFTRFYRVDNEMTREVGGTGLGLSIVKQLIELQGGEVGVQSQLGAGSTFTFTVPLAPGVETVATEPPPIVQEASPGAAVRQAVEQAAPQAAAGTILVVEDDPDVARLIDHHLGKAGYRVRVTPTAEDALAGLTDDLPDLITVDIQLPNMQGDELIRRLQADPLTSDIPVLILSVFADKASTQFGAFALPKPIDQEELVATVGRMLHESHHGPVLVVDDDPDMRVLLESVLQKQGFEVETAGNGESGLARAGELQPGLILLDLRMPDMDGFVVLRALKASQATADIPVIVMTGSSDLRTDSRARALALGAADFIPKPFVMDMLVEEVRLFLAAR